MTLVKKGTLTSPGATGNQATAGVGFTPQAIILFTANQTGEGNTHGHGYLSVGAGTRDAGATQQWTTYYGTADAITAADVSSAMSTAAVLEGYVVPGFTIDFTCTLVSFDADGFTLNWTDIPATAGIVVHYLALGGLTAARAGSFTTTPTVATQDVTVVAGFGQPDLMFMTSSSTGTVGGNASMYGWSKSSTEHRLVLHTITDGGSTTQVMDACSDGIIVTGKGNRTVAPTFDAVVILPATGWPTDGFRMSYSTQATAATPCGYMALKGATPCAVGHNTAPIGAPLAQTANVPSGVATGAMYIGQPITGEGTIDTTHASLGGMLMGASDGTSEGCIGVVDDDAATTSNTGRLSATTRAFRFATAPAVATNPPTTTSEASTTLSGTGATLTFAAADTLARAYSWVVFGAPPTTPIPDVVMAPPNPA